MVALAGGCGGSSFVNRCRGLIGVSLLHSRLLSAKVELCSSCFRTRCRNGKFKGFYSVSNDQNSEGLQSDLDTSYTSEAFGVDLHSPSRLRWILFGGDGFVAVLSFGNDHRRQTSCPNRSKGISFGNEKIEIGGFDSLHFFFYFYLFVSKRKPPVVIWSGHLAAIVASN